MLINDIISIISSIFLFFGFIIAIWQISLLSKQIRVMREELYNQLNWQKKNATFEYLNNYNIHYRETIMELQKEIDILKQDGKKLELKVLVTKINNSKFRVQLYEILSYFEHLASGIKNQYFDELICKELLSNVVISTFYLLKSYISLRRDETQVNVGSNLEQLVKKWEKERNN